MAAITSENRGAWQAIADDLSGQRPYPGRRVSIVGGRKHRGKVGTVRRHQVSRYENPFRYASGASAHMIEMAGRFGFVCLVRPDDGGPSFWVKADYTEVLDDSAPTRGKRGES